MVSSSCLRAAFGLVEEASSDFSPRGSRAIRKSTFHLFNGTMPALANGYIQFAFQGGAEAKGGLFQATQDENSVMFTKSQQPQFDAIRNEVQRLMSMSSGGTTASSADE